MKLLQKLLFCFSLAEFVSCLCVHSEMPVSFVCFLVGLTLVVCSGYGFLQSQLLFYFRYSVQDPVFLVVS